MNDKEFGSRKLSKVKYRKGDQIIHLFYIMIQIALAEPLYAENIGLKDIARSRRGELIMYYSCRFESGC